MDEEKDIFIKEKLQQDKIISDKANIVFKNFFKQEEERNYIENKTTSKLLTYKKILATAACLVILIGGANVYATTNGYGNIFFLVKYIVTGEKQDTNKKEEILSDRDITISYEKINITQNISLQIERLQIKENIAKLIIGVQENNTEKDITPFIYKVYDSNDNEIGAQNSNKSDKDSFYTDEVKIKNYNNNINVLKLKIYTHNMELLKSMKIDLKSRTIEIEDEGNQLKKISEIELKEILGLYVTLNTYQDFNTKGNKELWLNTNKIFIASELVMQKENQEQNFKLTTSKINQAIKELCGDEVKGNLKLIENNGIIKFNSAKNQYEYEPGDFIPGGLCLNIDKIEYKDGAYEVKFTYCYPSEGDYIGEGNGIENLAVYETTMKFKLNENYQYTKYCMIDVDKINSEKIKDEVL